MVGGWVTLLSSMTKPPHVEAALITEFKIYTGDLFMLHWMRLVTAKNAQIGG